MGASVFWGALEKLLHASLEHFANDTRDVGRKTFQHAIWNIGHYSSVNNSVCYDNIDSRSMLRGTSLAGCWPDLINKELYQEKERYEERWR